MENMLHDFNYTLEDSKSDLEYEFDVYSEEELEDDEPTQLRLEHINPMWFIPNRCYFFTKKSYILMVESLKYNCTTFISMIIVADLTFQDGEDAYLVNHQIILREWKLLAEQLQLLRRFSSLQQEESHFKTIIVSTMETCVRFVH